MSREFAGTIPYITPVDVNGSPIALSADGHATLLSGATYFFPLDVKTGTLESAHLQGDANATLTATIEDSNMMTDHVAPASAAAGDWIPENPTTAYVAATGTGWLATLAVVTAAGGAGGDGGAMFHLGNFGSTRMRLKVVMGAIATGAPSAQVRVAMASKA